MSSVHAHEFLAMVSETEQAKSLAQLTEMAQLRFGAEVRFHTCKASDLSIADLLNFLLDREKLIQQEGGYRVNAARVCNH